MRVRILGCSGGISAGAKTSSMLIDDTILLDAGTGVGDLTRQELGQIRHVLLTHSHLDHISNLPFLVDAIFDKLDGDHVTVHARTETIIALRDHIFNWLIWPDFTTLPNTDEPVLRFNPLEPDEERQIGAHRFRAVEVEHTVPSQGYIISGTQATFALSGDTSTNETLWPRLNQLENLDALIVEVSFPNSMAELADISGHYVPATLAADLEQLDHHPEIWLNAMKPGEEELIMQQVKAALPMRQVRMLTTGMHLNI